jgi:hypothetical protein
METEWFYLAGEERQGPLPLGELVAVVVAAPDPHSVHVWHEGWTDWQAAGAVPEISRRLPPPRPSGPPVPFEQAEKIAKLYRRLVLLVGSQLLLGYFVLLPSGVGEPSTVGSLVALVGTLALLGITVAMVATTYRLAGQLEAGVPALWAAGMFLGCISIIVLLVLSHKAQVWCRQHGIKVGFFGPTKASIEELKRRGMTSAFD